MFGAWNNIAKSAEAMVSRWAVKRVFKFLLKKKLGQFILGDIDLEQLDVQLTDGTIQLSDLALNVDYLNQKIGPATSLVIKEGSIGSLLVKMPWKGKGCQVEVDELELLLSPCSENHFSGADKNCSSNDDDNHYMQGDLGKFSNDVAGSDGKSDNVHEGVKTIAKMVKWFLTSFNVKIKRLIVAFDPSLEKDEKVGFHRTLVLRISEAECGTCVSEDADLGEDRAHSFLGFSQLTNFVKFQGAVLELLNSEDVDNQFCAPQVSGMTSSGLCSDCLPSNAALVMSGKRGGFSGNLKLSIPWKNGSLDIRKVDADVFVDPLELRFQPSTIKWFLLSWETYKNFDKVGKNIMHYKTADSIYLNSNSQFQSSTSVSAAAVADKVIANQGSFSADCTSLHVQESVAESLLPGSHIIPNWIPNSVSKNQRDCVGEVDFGASVDQFFECFDGMRNSQSALGSSGMWNWTCSVFSAITAASSLATGSLHIPSEQQHVETNLKAAFAGISIVLSFHDEDQDHLYDLNGDVIKNSSDIHYLGIDCRDISLLVQVCPQEMRFEGTIELVEAADYLCCKKDGGDCSNNIDSKTLSIRNLQAEVQRALPVSFPSAGGQSSDVFCGLVSADFLCKEMGDMVKIMLFSTSGATHFQCTLSSRSSAGGFSGPTSFSLKLPPLIFWFNFCLLKMLSDLLNEIGKSIRMGNGYNNLLSDPCNEKCESSHPNVKSGSGPSITTLSTAETLQGNISIPNARVILCFPFKMGEDDGGCPSWDQFIVLDISSPSSLKNRMQDNSPNLDGSLCKRFSSSGKRSLHLSMGNLCIYLVTSAQKDGIGIDCGGTQRHKFSAQKILSVSNRTGYLSVISMFWQEGTVTGPWIAERAKFLAMQEENRSRSKSMGKGYEFATVTTLKDLDDISAQTRQEIIMSTAYFVHIHLFAVIVDLDCSQYSGLHNLLNQMITGLSYFSGDATGSSKKVNSMPQNSFLLECDSVEITIRPDAVENVKGPMQSELPGSWGCLKLKIQKFELLSVSSMGGIRDSSFLWLTHREGTLWGSVSGIQDQEFLLISCSDSTMKRGDGGGSNALSSRLAGSDIVHFWEPESCQDFTSITVRCSTIVAVGGRLDWMNVICSFFSVPSVDPKQSVHSNLEKKDLDMPAGGSSFSLKLVDVALSYEPYVKHLAACIEVLDSESAASSSAREDMPDPCVGCLLAASSFCLSNTTVADSLDNEYKIRVQDLGLLIRAVSENDKLVAVYSAEQLDQGGYVKVAREALIEAVVKTNCKNGLLWEVGCSKSQIFVETCHDTTSGLIRLAAQLQQLFAPDLEQSIVHLQTRWDNFQQAQQRNDEKNRVLNCDSGPSTSQIHTPNVVLEGKHGVAGLMDEICEDAFHLDRNETFQFNSSESECHLTLEENVAEETCSLSFENAEMFSHDLPINNIGLESCQTSFLQKGYFPELIDSYCLPELRPLTELSTGTKSSHEVLKYRSIHVGEGDLGRAKSGWYEDASLKIVENHISEPSGQTALKEVVEGKLSHHDDSSVPDDMVKIIGRVLLKNINVRWRMYAGSDWCETEKSNKQSKNIHGRDATVCLELAVSGMEFQYDIFPASGISVSKLSFSVHDLHLYDESSDAPWKLVLGYYYSKDHPRESSSKALKLDLEAVRPDPSTPLEEYRLRIAFLPMLLRLHQSQLEFLISFFGEKSSSIDQSMGPQEPDLLVKKSNNLAGHVITNEALLPYFQKFDIWPILIRVDYSPRRVDLAALRDGKYVELVNIVPWKGVELELKHVHAVGVYGWGSVCETIIGEWLEDISQNQIHKVLHGLPPVRSLVAVGAAAGKLVSSPLESYRKDQRVLKGMQRGTIAFLRSISLETVALGVHLAAGTRDFLLHAEYMFTTIPPVSQPLHGKKKTNMRHNQPNDARQGIQQAYESISDGFEKSASALVQTPLKKYQRGATASTALATAFRAVPTAAIAPASACASAIHCALLGFRNSLDPQRKKESMEKYLGPTLPQDPN